jgi:hypothetical protein
MSVEQHETTESAEPTVRRRRPALMSLLVEAGVASEDDLRHAFEEGLERGVRLGDVVLARGWIGGEGLARLLARQWSIPFLPRESLGLDPAAATLLSTEQAQELQACAIGTTEDGPTVVIAEPTTQRLEALKALLGESTRFAVVTEESLDGLLAQRARVGPARPTVVSDDAPTEDDDSPASAALTSAAPEPSSPDLPAAATADELTDVLVAELEQATEGITAARERIEQLAGARHGAEQLVADLNERLTHVAEERTRQHERSREIEAELEAERERSRALRSRIAELLAEFEG